MKYDQKIDLHNILERTVFQSIFPILFFILSFPIHPSLLSSFQQCISLYPFILFFLSSFSLPTPFPIFLSSLLPLCFYHPSLLPPFSLFSISSRSLLSCSPFFHFVCILPFSLFHMSLHSLPPPSCPAFPPSFYLTGKWVFSKVLSQFFSTLVDLAMDRCNPSQVWKFINYDFKLCL